MTNHRKNKILALITSVLILSLSIGYAVSASWNGPTASPPGDNVLPPLNTGNLLQVKDAGLMLNYSGNVAGFISLGAKTNPAGGGCPAGYDWYDYNNNTTKDNGECQRTALYTTGDGNVGIGTTNPEFKLSLDNDGGIIAKGTFGSGADLVTTGQGAKMIWYPKKAAFRAGYANGGVWDDANIGNYSFAAGSSTTASGVASFAAGSSARASASYSVALGLGSIATGFSATAIGENALAEGANSFALGHNTIAGTSSGANNNAVAIGRGARATADGSFVFSSQLNDVTFLVNNIPDSFMIGSNSDQPTLFISPGSGLGTSGHVGIGTTTPVAKLDIDMTNLTATEGFRITRDAAASHYAYLNIEDESANPIFKVHENGNVGIGTILPARSLEVMGNVLFSGSSEGFNTFSLPNADIDAGGGPDGIFGIRVVNNPARANNRLDIIGTSLAGVDNSTPAMTVNLRNSNVGIGTSDPQSPLHVKPGELRLESTNVLNYTDIHFSNNRAVAPFGKEYVIGNYAPDMADVNIRNKFFIRDNSGGGDRFIIDTNGNVGIGTTTPGAKLHLANASGAADLELQSLPGNTASADIHLKNPVQEFSMGTQGTGDPNVPNSFFIHDTNVGGVAGYRFVIKPATGNVGIGTTTPVAKLEINSALRLTPVATPPFTCNVSNTGSMYYDNSNALCICNGSTFDKIGAGTCL